MKKILLLLMLLQNLSAITNPLYFQLLSDSTAPIPSFGMRMRPLPNNSSQIHAPVIITKAPTNEATAIKINSKCIKIFYINRPGKADKMMSISSTDHGMHWSEPEVEFNLPGEAYYANQVLVDKFGTIHSVFHIYSIGSMGYKGKQLDLWYTQKPVSGKWSVPKMIKAGYVGSIRGFIELKNGTLLIPMSEADSSRALKPTNGQIDYGLFEVMTIQSSDHGSTWTRSSNTLKIPVDPNQVTRYGAVEPNAIQLKDGKIWMLIRTNKGFLYESFSSDNGITWSEAKQTSFISSDSPASLMRLSNNDLILILNSNQRYDDPRSYANGGRESLQAAISHDDGISWKGFREVLVSPPNKPIVRGDRGTAYPSPVELDNNKILFVSGQGEESSIVAFEPKWLDESIQEDNFSEDFIQWTFHGSKENIGIWNFPMLTIGKLTIQCKPIQHSCPVKISLNTHFTIAGDSLSHEKSPLHFEFTAPKDGGKLILQWNIEKKSFTVFLNNKRIVHKRIEIQHITNGFNFMRFQVKDDIKTGIKGIIHSIHSSPSF